ncbi:hypothetical protein LCGC14_0074350 [marine sediment metagenome]|uniref:Uncharacterized protein n=1 Tax=marine sediment metagenome TaxID=412755 RepID=A0A0F9YMF3_9ZZZZ|nr:hypothetical protein [Halomonas sp.]
MIKKAVLPLLTAPFLMVFADFTEAQTFVGYVRQGYCRPDASQPHNVIPVSECSAEAVRAANIWLGLNPPPNSGFYSYELTSPSKYRPNSSSTCSSVGLTCVYVAMSFFERFSDIPEGYYGSQLTDEQCATNNNGTFTTSDPSVYNYLSSGGSVRANGGACTVSSTGGVSACTGSGETLECTINVESTSTGEFSTPGVGIDGSLQPSSPSVPDETPNIPSYLTPLPGGCSDASNCLTIGETSYVVDWSTAPDYFSYVDSNGVVRRNPSGGGGGDTGGGDSGNGNGDNPGGGGSGGGSTVPDFEFDDSGIIEAIRSSGQSNRNSINALSNDVTGAIRNQTNDLNAATSAQTESLNNTINSQTSELVTQGDRQTGRVTTAITAQTQSVQNTLDNQTRSLNSTLEGMQKAIVDGLKNVTVRFSGGGGGGGSSGGGDGDGDGEGDGEDEGAGIDGFLDSLIDKLASRFTEDLGDGNDLFNSSDLDDTLDGIAAQEEQHADDVGSLMDDIGDGATSGIADQVTSRLPSLPSGGCVPLQFGPMEISCQAFNTIKLWLTWIIYFWTVVSIVDTFFRSEQRTA